MNIKEYKILDRTTVKGFILNNISKKYYRYLKRLNATFYINNKQVRTHELANPDDILRIEFEEEIKKDIVPMNLKLKIIYEDKNCMVVYKPAHLQTIPSTRNPYESLYNAIANYLNNENKNATIHFISRLDKETQGLILVALNKETAQFMNKNKSSMNKIYIAIVDGIISEKNGVIQKPIAKSFDGIKREVSINGQNAITHYEILKECNNKSLVKLRLETGRTHQIRVHLSSLGTPIDGDELYGTKGDVLKLCASELSFKNIDGTRLHFYYKPEWMDQFENQKQH